MKKNTLTGIFCTLVAVAFIAGCESKKSTTPDAKPGATETTATTTFGSDVEFLKKHTDVVLLENGDAQVALAPAYQGRVMTSTCGGLKGPSFGWINYKVVEKGIKPEAEREGLEKHIYVFGGEERFWFGPEGGQFSVYFPKGAEFTFDNWKVPAPIDTDAYKLASSSKTEATFEHNCALTNWSGVDFNVGIKRTVKILSPETINARIGLTLDDSIKQVAYETHNEISNTGTKAWTKETGLLSVWLLGMYNPSPKTTIVIPFKTGDEATLGRIVKDDYFGKVPPEHLIVKDKALFFRGDGTMRNKIGLSPARSLGVAGSYAAEINILTVVMYELPTSHDGYVNSSWELQDKPFAGDALNSYNDGSPGPGLAPLGPFYEIESSSPALALAPQTKATHVQATMHFSGDRAMLDKIAKKLLKASLKEIETAFSAE